MKDSTDLLFIIIIIVCLIGCYHKFSILSNRMDMIIMVQQSQQKSINQLLNQTNENQ